MPVPGKKVDTFPFVAVIILPDCGCRKPYVPDPGKKVRQKTFLTALMTATVSIGTGMFSVYINLAKTSYIFCVIGVVIVIFACMYGIIDRNK